MVFDKKSKYLIKIRKYEFSSKFRIKPTILYNEIVKYTDFLRNSKLNYGIVYP